jgi:hypothetical protein
MRKALFFILGVLSVLVIGYFAITNVSAGPKECPSGQRGDCSTYQQKQTGMVACFPNNANLGNGWEFLHSGCKDDNIDPVPTLIPPTPVPFFVTPTVHTGTTATVIVPKFTPTSDSSNNNDPKNTPTPTLVLILDATPNNSCSNSCLCLIVTQLAISNDLERTQIAVDLQNNSCPIP